MRTNIRKGREPGNEAMYIMYMYICVYEYVQ